MPLVPQSATAERQAQPVSPVNARVGVRTGAQPVSPVNHVLVCAQGHQRVAYG